MWIKTEEGKAVDASKIVGLTFFKEVDDPDRIKSNVKTVYKVYALMVGSYSFSLQTFDNEEDAEKCVEEIVNALNGDEKVGYSFSWLKKSEPADTEKPAEGTAEKPKDKTPALIDGIAL